MWDTTFPSILNVPCSLRQSYRTHGSLHPTFRVSASVGWGHRKFACPRHSQEASSYFSSILAACKLSWRSCLVSLLFVIIVTLSSPPGQSSCKWVKNDYVDKGCRDLIHSDLPTNFLKQAVPRPPLHVRKVSAGYLRSAECIMGPQPRTWVGTTGFPALSFGGFVLSTIKCRLHRGLQLRPLDSLKDSVLLVCHFLRLADLCFTHMNDHGY